jgi:predicted alpha/beta-hydrolase family hydrolase
MTPQPDLAVDTPRGPVRGIALVLHGGRSASLEPTRARQLSVLRMIPFATALKRAGAKDGLAVARLRFAVRGWNGGQRSPVADARWALGQLAERFPDTPVVLVGHSMGGRTAFYVTGYPTVAGTVALAPWVERGDPVEQLAGRRLLIAHGTRDRMTSAAGSAAYARLARTAGAEVTYVGVEADSHAMLRRASVWHRLTAGWTVGVLFGSAPDPSGGPTDTALAEALAGAGSLVV